MFERERVGKDRRKRERKEGWKDGKIRHRKCIETKFKRKKQRKKRAWIHACFR